MKMLPNPKWLALNAIMLSMVAPLSAQESEKKVVTLDETVVAATKTERSADQVSVSYSSYDAEDFERKQAAAVRDVLGEAPGVYVLDGTNIGGTSEIKIRGMGQLRSTTVVDGIRANNAVFSEGNLFEVTSTMNLEPVEIIRGPQSTLYGSNAIGGVIVLNTLKGQGKETVRFTGELGTFDTMLFGVQAQGQNDKFHYSFHGAHQNSDNGRESATGSVESYSFRFDYDISDTTTIGFMSRGSFSQIEEVPALELQATGELSTDIGVDAISAAFYVENQTSDQWYQKLNFSLYDEYYELRNPNPFAFTPVYIGDSSNYGAEWLNRYDVNEEITLVGGLYRERMKGNDNSFDEKEADNWSAYAQVEYYPENSPFSLVAGVRHDDFEFGGEADTYRINGAYYIDETDTRIHAAYGTAFRAPNFFRLFSTAAFALGNPALKNEESESWEIGVDQYLWEKKALAGITYYENNVDNLVAYLDTGNFTGTYTNRDEAKVKGVEFYLRAFPNDNWETELNYTFTDSKSKSASTGIWSRERATPSHQVTWINDYVLTSNISIGGRFDWIIDRESSSYNGSVDVDDYKLLRVYTRYDVSDKFSIKARIENALDDDYTRSQGFSGRNPGHGIEGFVGFDYTF